MKDTGFGQVSVKEKILEVLKKADWPMTTGEIARSIDLARNSVQKYLLTMAGEGILRFKKIGTYNQFWLNQNYKEFFQKAKKQK